MLLCYKGNEIKQVSGGFLLLFFPFLTKEAECRLLGEETALGLWGGVDYSLDRPT